MGSEAGTDSGRGSSLSQGLQPKLASHMFRKPKEGENGSDDESWGRVLEMSLLRKAKTRVLGA